MQIFNGESDDNLKRMRSIDNQFIEDLNSGVLKPYLDSVKLDDALCLQIRDGYINIYYRGGNLFRISPTKRKGYKIFFDLNYSNLQRELLSRIDPYDCDGWIANIQTLKSEMDIYLSAHPKLEREFQQLIERENNASRVAAGTDYFIADIEYANMENGSRFDMLGVKWRTHGKGIDRRDPKKATISFIEVKYGDQAMKGDAGVKKHVEDIISFLDKKRYRSRITREVTSLFNQKYELGLIPSAPKEIEIQQDCSLELIILVGNHNPASKRLDAELMKVYKSPKYQELLNLGCSIKIARASLLGYGLYDNDKCMIPIEKYLEEYLEH